MFHLMEMFSFHIDSIDNQANDEDGEENDDHCYGIAMLIMMRIFIVMFIIINIISRLYQIILLFYASVQIFVMSFKLCIQQERIQLQTDTHICECVRSSVHVCTCICACMYVDINYVIHDLDNSIVSSFSQRLSSFWLTLKFCLQILFTNLLKYLIFHIIEKDIWLFLYLLKLKSNTFTMSKMYGSI